MDKSTLSNYGWIVAVVVVLAIMISLATPFGSVIRDNVESQVTKFQGTASGALSAAGGASSFDDLSGGGSGGGAHPTLISFTIDGAGYQAEENMTFGDWLNSSYATDFPREKAIRCDNCGENTAILGKSNEIVGVGGEHHYIYKTSIDEEELVSDVALQSINGESYNIFPSSVLKNNANITLVLYCHD